MWVRSQNKKFLICATKIAMVWRGEDFLIIVNDEPVGEYKSKEQALDVLDEIQNYLEEAVNKTFVYQLPKDYE